MSRPADPVELYSVLWTEGPPPDLDAFLGQTGPVAARQLADLACTDHRARWKAGDRVPVEAYFERFPQLRVDPALALDLVYGEALLHEREGTPAETDLSRRFPDLADALQTRIGLHRAVTPAAPTTTVPLSGRFGRYEIQRQLGRGGMGAVYLARDTQLNRLVALKVPLLAGDPARAKQFLREARAAAALQHPNLCPVYDFGEVDGRPYLTMAYLDGEPLSELVGRGPLPIREAVTLVRTLAEALEEAHRAGIVHRDLKPSNVVHNAKGQPVITDFGLARNLTATGLDTLSDNLVGTPYYMAPEQVSGDSKDIGPGTDVYALGVVLYELLTGTRPFGGALGPLLIRITSEDPGPVSRLRPEVDARLSAICQKALAKRAADRYPSMAAFAAALDGWSRGLSEPATVAPRSPHRASIGLAAGVLLIAVVVLIWRPWQSASKGDPPPAPSPETVVRDPAGANVRAKLAWRLNDSDELDRAIVESTAALRLDDECVSALLCRANAKIKKGDPRAGIADLDRAVEVSPRDHEPEIDLAWAYNDLGEHAKALAHADRAISYKADAHEAHCQRGEANRRLGNPRAAIEDLTTAISHKPDYYLAYRERAKAYRDLGETALAAADEKEADSIEAKGKK